MSVYAVGDVQGCYRELLDLLDRVNYDEGNDRLWFAGDLVNKGPDSLATLRFARRHDAVTVLGNHDLHLLAVAAGGLRPGPDDTFADVLAAPDRDDLLSWLRRRPLLHRDGDWVLLHGGLPPQWDLGEARERAAEVEGRLASADYRGLLADLYGDRPDLWDDGLRGGRRLRFIVNAFTRIRYCNAAGRLDFSHKGPPGSQPPGWLPWFSLETRRSRGVPILFGHWASVHYGALRDFSPYQVFPLDTGCVWGGRLSALRLEDRRWFDVPSRQPRR